MTLDVHRDSGLQLYAGQRVKLHGRYWRVATISPNGADWLTVDLDYLGEAV